MHQSQDPFLNDLVRRENQTCYGTQTKLDQSSKTILANTVSGVVPVKLFNYPVKN